VVVIVMGVAGSGKTTVGSALAAARGWRFVDADDVHGPDNVAKMARGEALTDADRAPWLARLRATIVDALAQNTPLVLACSALKAAYRETLVDGDGARVRVVHLAATPALLRQRLEARPGHYMKATMLDGQLATLEAPADALTLDASLPVATLVGAIETGLGLNA
jgi:gluconokinase